MDTDEQTRFRRAAVQALARTRVKADVEARFKAVADLYAPLERSPRLVAQDAAINVELYGSVLRPLSRRRHYVTDEEALDRIADNVARMEDDEEE